jgi:hypothetical protein
MNTPQIPTTKTVLNNHARAPLNMPPAGRGISPNQTQQAKAPAVVNAGQQRAPVSNPHARLV